jgi:hypothetical protein
MRDYIITRDSSDCLQHFGIKGQKWGIRRYENADGTLTAEGYERYYGKRFEKESRKQQRLNYKADQDKQVRLAKDHSTKAKKHAAIGLAGAATAAAGYGLMKTIRPEDMSATNVTYHESGRGAIHRMMYGSKFGQGLAGALGVGIGGSAAIIGLGEAAYHGIKATVANYRASVAGHAKAAKKAKEHLEGMKEMFWNTPYAQLIDKRFGGLNNGIRNS